MSEERLNRIALSKGVAAAEREALKSSRARVRVTVEGLLGLDRKHMLVSGTRSFAGVAQGAVFYDPIMDEVAIVRPQAEWAWVIVGPLEAREILKNARHSRWNKVLLDSIEYASGAPDAGVEFVSEWLVRRIAEGVTECLALSTPSGSQASLVKRDPEYIWRALGNAWVVQPWGIPLPPEALGGLA
jgi:hypothetical protein